MPDNPYTREATITILEVVPERDQLPFCNAWLGGESLEQCGNRARYVQNGQPVCGIHVGRPSLLWHPDTRKPKRSNGRA